MNDPGAEAARWLEQAESDLAFARLGAERGFHAQGCFMAQQAAEKALKAVLYGRGERVVIGHSVARLLERALAAAGLDIDDTAADDAAVLDQYYVPTRYPNGLPEGAPASVFRRSQADDAVARAERLLALAHEHARPPGDARI